MDEGIVPDTIAAMDESALQWIGHAGRFFRRNTDPAHLELTVVDTFIIPESFSSRVERRILERIYRADPPLIRASQGSAGSPVRVRTA